MCEPTAPNSKTELNSQLRKMREENQQLKQELTSLKKECESLRQRPAPHPQPQGASALARNPLLWKGCARLPSGFVRPHVVVKEGITYVGGGNGATLEASRTVFRYNAEQDSWTNLPIAPNLTFALALVKGFVTAVGGTSVMSSSFSNALVSFDDNPNKWCRKFPAMPTERCASSAVSTESHLVVVGGVAGNDQHYTSIVEVLDLTTMTWSNATPTPKPLTFMSIAFCPLAERIYMTGGLTESGALRSVLSCRVNNLIKSAHDDKQGPAQDSNSASPGSVWEVITDAPYFRSGCAVIKGKLITASGLDSRDRTTTRIHAFDAEAKSWVPLGEMAGARSSCSIAVFSESRVLIVGGYVDPRSWTRSLTTDVIESVNLQV